MTFTPTKYVISKDRKRGIVVSGDINWNELSEDELRTQWITCVNSLWFAEKEGIVTRKDLEPYFYEYLKALKCPPDHIKFIRKLKESQISNNLLFIAFVLQNGAINKTSAQYFISKIKELVLLGRQIKDAQEEPTILNNLNPSSKSKNLTVQEAMKNRLSEIIGELQGLEDEMAPNIFKWLQSHNIPRPYIQSIQDYYRPRLEELKSLSSAEDEQLKEGYAPYRKKEINEMLSWYTELMSDLDAYKRIKQNQQKTRVRKPKPPSKIVAKLKYMSYSDDYKIQSIKPESIIGCSVLWLFNTKKRRLCVYNASETEKELNVRGTTILGWDPKTSVGKTLRKPPEQLKEFMSGGKVAMRNFQKTIRGKEALLNGRINKDMLILKVY